mmetsp:Transcript_2426/g.3671  ORF Transcript_2426/g.3671 Transcript_2426/m.3671 type:complete len:549 (-) Transcript_2426:135-1781(-)
MSAPAKSIAQDELDPEGASTTTGPNAYKPSEAAEIVISGDVSNIKDSNNEVFAVGDTPGSSLSVHQASASIITANNQHLSGSSTEDPRQSKKQRTDYFTLPKEPLTAAYSYYANSVRESVQQQHPEMGHQEVSQETIRRFNELPPEERQYWNELANQEKEVYGQALELETQTGAAAGLSTSTSLSHADVVSSFFDDPALCNITGQVDVPVVALPPFPSSALLEEKLAGESSFGAPPSDKLHTKSADPTVPKKPFQPYIYFSRSIRNEIKQQNPDFSFSDIGKEMGRLYKELSPEQKEYWNEVARKEKEAYDQAMETYLANPPVDSQQSLSDTHAAKKKATDPNAPKKPRNAYLHFSNSVRESVKQQNPELSPNSISKEVARKFRELPAEEKYYWKEIVRQEKESYAGALEAYNNNTPYSSSSSSFNHGIKKNPKLKPKEAVDPNAPKKPYTAYIYFSNHIRPDVKQQYPEMTFAEIAREMGRRFQQLSPEEKSYWQHVATSEKERYDRELEAYNASLAAAPAPAMNADFYAIQPPSEDDDEKIYQLSI